MIVRHKIIYVVCIVTLTLLAFITGLTLQHRIDEKVAIVSFGGPLYIYLGLARTFHAGELFNIVLFFVVAAGYLAILLAPLYYILRSFKWLLVFVQLALVIVHFLIGASLVWG